MSKRLLIIFAYVIGSVLIFITTFHPEYRPLLFVGLGIVGVAFIITLIFVFGWKPDVEEEIKAFKRAPAVFHRIVFVIPCILFGFVLHAMGINRKTAELVAVCLAILLLGIVQFWFYKNRGKGIKRVEKELTNREKIKKLESELAKELEKGLTRKANDEPEQ